MRGLCERSFGGDRELMIDKLPIEVLEELDPSVPAEPIWR
jgi:hypothetical protein